MGVVTCVPTYWENNLKEDKDRRSAGLVPGSAPRQCPHYVDDTGTFLTGDVKPLEQKGTITFEKRQIKCPHTDSFWWMKYHANPDYVGEHSTMVQNGQAYYVPQVRVGEEFKTMNLEAPMPILELTKAERIGDVCTDAKDEEIRKIEQDLIEGLIKAQSTQCWDTPVTKTQERIVAPKHTDLRTDQANEFVKFARLTCWDSDHKKVEFKIAFTATLKVGSATSAWNRLIRGCCVFDGSIETYSKEELHQMIHEQDMDPENPPLFVTEDPGRYNMPSRESPFYFFLARINKERISSQEESVFDTIIAQHELEKRNQEPQVMETEIEHDKTAENESAMTDDDVFKQVKIEEQDDEATNSKQQVANEAMVNEEESMSTDDDATGSKELAGLEPGAPINNDEGTAIAGLTPECVNNPFEPKEIQGFREGCFYRNIRYKRNPDTHMKKTAKLYSAPPG